MRLSLSASTTIALLAIMTTNCPLAGSQQAGNKAQAKTTGGSPAGKDTLSKFVSQNKDWQIENDLRTKALKASEAHNYTEAEQIYNQMLKKAQQSGDLTKQADAWLQLGALSAQQKQYPEAEKRLKTALAFSEKTSGNTGLATTMTVSMLEEVLEQEAKYSEAEPLMKRLRDQYERSSPDDLPLAMILDRNAILYAHLGKTQEAKELTARAEAIRKARAPGPKQAEDERLGLSAQIKGDNATAETQFKAALEQAEKDFGPKDIRYAEALSELAGVYRQEKKYKEAESAYRKVLDIQRAKLGAQDSNVGLTMMLLSGVLKEEGRDAESMEMTLAANKIMASAMQKVDPKMAANLQKLNTSAEKAYRQYGSHLSSQKADNSKLNDIIMRANMRTLQLAVESYATKNGKHYPASISTSLCSYLPGGGNDGKRAGRPFTNPFTKAQEWPVLGTITDVAKVRAAQPGILAPGKIEYSPIGTKSYAIRGGGTNGHALAASSGGTLVLSNK